MRLIISILSAFALMTGVASATSLENTNHGMLAVPAGEQVAASLQKKAGGGFSFSSSRSSSGSSGYVNTRKANAGKPDVPVGMGSRSGSVVARVSLASQTMTVSINGSKRYTWKISSGRAGYSTPRGSYRPQRLYSSYYSKKYDLAAMPYSVFFNGGYAVHGTWAVGRLGSRASHGCIRLSNGNARTFFDLARTYGRNVKIIIS